MKTGWIAFFIGYSLLPFSFSAAQTPTAGSHGSHHPNIIRSAPWNNFLQLDGVLAYAETSDHDELDVGDDEAEAVTIEAWINFTEWPVFPTIDHIMSKSGAYALSIYEEDPTGFKYRGLDFGFHGTYQGGGVVFGFLHWEASGPLWNPGWHHIAGVIAKSPIHVSLYLDGWRIENSYPPFDESIINSDSPLTVGDFLQGYIDEMRISTIARYTGDSYVIPSSPFTPDEHTRGLWHFDEPGGSTEFHDVSGHDNILYGMNGCITAVREKGYSPSLPTDFTMLQNYPNPFNGSTIIRFVLPKSSEVRLTIFNHLGQRVETLMDGERSGGEYEVEWIPEHIPSGIYYCQFKTGDTIETRKLIYQK